MIDLSLTAQGTVKLEPRTQEDLEELLEVPYVRMAGRRGATWWPYLSDLQRDVGPRLRWRRGTKSHLAVLLKATREITLGDDAEVKRVFAPGRQPYPFQLEAIHAGLNVERLLLADSTGLGKTIEALGVMLVAFARRSIERAIPVVPSGIKQQWHEEIHEFARHPPGSVVVASGGPDKRAQLYRRKWDVLIVSPKVVKHDEDLLSKLVVDDVGLVALDEASMIRNATTDIADTMKWLFAKTRYRLALTATPVENCLVDLRSIAEFVEPRGFLSEKYFNKRYVVWKTYRQRTRGGGTITQKKPVRYRNLGEVRKKIRPFYIRRTVSEVGLQLPELVVKWELLDLPPRQRKVYDAVRDKLEPKMHGLRGKALRAPLQALRQACNSTELVEVAGARARPGQVKVDRLRELLETDLAGEQVIVFTDYERFGAILADALKAFRPAMYGGPMSKRARQRAVDGFRAGDRRILIGTMALERGHNLQNAAIVANADMPFNPARLKQRIGRVRRLGSEHLTCVSINMVARDTVEERLILRRIYEKRAVFEGVFGDDELSEADPIESMRGRDLRGLL